ncbi:MAG: hypothetical protein QM652_08200 [Legionella sp.]|uniref:hypothetical protein n=1 Tax=Legionella sp. TaxID=459 RepID=UPI0039E42CF7
MKIFCIVKIKKDVSSEQVLNDSSKNSISPRELTLHTSGIRDTKGYTSRSGCVSYGKSTSTRARGNKGTGIVLVTDAEVSEDDFNSIERDILNYKWPLSQLKNEIDLNDFRTSFFHRITNLDEGIDRSSLSLLAPLRNKLAQERDSTRQGAAKLMIHSIEDALLDRLENKIDTEVFKQRLNNAINIAEPVLEQQSGWKKFIDDAINSLLRLFFNNTQYVTFFSSPNRFKVEIEEVKIKGRDLNL